MAVIIHLPIIKKLSEKHDVTEKEVNECLANRYRGSLEDTREDHKTDPPTKWIVSKTNHNRILKVIFIITVEEDGSKNVIIKSAYNATPEIIDIYERHSKPL